jgi:hypothetical protein
MRARKYHESCVLKDKKDKIHFINFDLIEFSIKHSSQSKIADKKSI